MPIRPFLAGQAFEPEAIKDMSLALEIVCAEIGVEIRDDPVTRTVAKKIVEFAQMGLSGEKLRDALIHEFKPDLRSVETPTKQQIRS